MDPLVVIVSILGGVFGGTASTLINWWRTEYTEKKERKIKFLDDQLRNLYGPLFNLTLQSEKLFELNKRFHNAGNEEFAEKEYSTEKSTQDTLQDELTKTMEIRNEYIAGVETNNLKIKEILDNNYYLIDPDDIEVFLLFYEHHTRLITETKDEGGLKTPFQIYMNVGEISIFPPEVIKRVKEKFLNKKKELDMLRGIKPDQTTIS